MAACLFWSAMPIGGIEVPFSRCFASRQKPPPRQALRYGDRHNRASCAVLPWCARPASAPPRIGDRRQAEADRLLDIGNGTRCRVRNLAHAVALAHFRRIEGFLDGTKIADRDIGRLHLRHPAFPSCRWQISRSRISRNLSLLAVRDRRSANSAAGQIGPPEHVDDEAAIQPVVGAGDIERRVGGIDRGRPTASRSANCPDGRNSRRSSNGPCRKIRSSPAPRRTTRPRPCWPRPSRSRASSAIRMALQADMPVTMSMAGGRSVPAHRPESRSGT